ncbi:MAG: DUF366 family protein [Pelotomaculum sp.]|jgi:hypothetical protein
MLQRFLPDIITYDGTQLSSHWAFRTQGILGDSIVSFQGPCRVMLAEMVDLEDVRKNAPIFSHNMLHFIVEHFDTDLEKMILRQRMLMAIIKDVLMEKHGAKLIRNGDDLYEGDKKLSVSIATLTPVSTMVHTGLNIVSKDTPVKTVSLKDLGIKDEDIEPLGNLICSRYSAEIKEISLARCKVRGTK